METGRQVLFAQQGRGCVDVRRWTAREAPVWWPLVGTGGWERAPSSGQRAGLPWAEVACRGMASQGLREKKEEPRAEASVVWVCGAAVLGEEGLA